MQTPRLLHLQHSWQRQAPEVQHQRQRPAPARRYVHSSVASVRPAVRLRGNGGNDAEKQGIGITTRNSCPWQPVGTVLLLCAMEERLARLEALVEQQIAGKDKQLAEKDKEMSQLRALLRATGSLRPSQAHADIVQSLVLQRNEEEWARERGRRAEILALDKKVADLSLSVHELNRQLEGLRADSDRSRSFGGVAGAGLATNNAAARYSFTEEVARLKAVICEAEPPAPASQPNPSAIASEHETRGSSSGTNVAQEMPDDQQQERVSLACDTRTHRRLRLHVPCQSGGDNDALTAEFRTAVAQQLGLQPARIDVLDIEIESDDETPSVEDRRCPPPPA
jgi:uncharacterized coiled-coil protein SlyX